MLKKTPKNHGLISCRTTNAGWSVAIQHGICSRNAQKISARMLWHAILIVAHSSLIFVSVGWTNKLIPHKCSIGFVAGKHIAETFVGNLKNTPQTKSSQLKTNNKVHYCARITHHCCGTGVQQAMQCRSHQQMTSSNKPADMWTHLTPLWDCYHYLLLE